MKHSSSGARASTSPHGSTIIEPPKLSLSGGCVPIWSAATTNAWFSIARARTRISQWARAPDEECFIAANLDFARQDEVRDKLPSLANRMAGAYRWPDEVTA
jgi:hypothetical protein